MEISDQIALIAAIVVGGGTLTLAIMTWRSIRQTRAIQKNEKRQELLNEIIEWAAESSKSAIYRQKTDNSELWRAKLNYKYCTAKSEYIKGIVVPSFPTLFSKVEDIVTKLNEAIKNTTKLIESKSPDNHEGMFNSEQNLIVSVIELFKEAAKVRTEDIS